MTSERIQKVLSAQGVGSRRAIEDWIREGRITINGRQAVLGDHCTDTDRIIVNGRPIQIKKLEAAETRVLLYHKPIGEVVSRNDPEGRPVIFTQIPKLDRGRWISVGRLDINTQGLLLLTNNGELANRMMHPSYEVEREYAVRVLGTVSPNTIERLLSGVDLEDGFAKFLSIREAGGEGANHWYHVTTAEGRNRIVRRLWESQGVVVSRLIRIRYGMVGLPAGLRLGQSYELPTDLIEKLMSSVGLKHENKTVQVDNPEKPANKRPQRQGQQKTQNRQTGPKRRV